MSKGVISISRTYHRGVTETASPDLRVGRLPPVIGVRWDYGSTSGGTGETAAGTAPPRAGSAVPYARRKRRISHPVLIINRWSGDGKAGRYGPTGAAAYSRVHTGVHYPGGSVVGSLLGLGFGGIVNAAARNLEKRT